MSDWTVQGNPAWMAARKEAAQKQREIKESAMRVELTENRMRGKEVTAVALDFQHRAEYFRYQDQHLVKLHCSSTVRSLDDLLLHHIHDQKLHVSGGGNRAGYWQGCQTDVKGYVGLHVAPDRLSCFQSMGPSCIATFSSAGCCCLSAVMWANQQGSDDAMQGPSWGPAQLPRLLCVQTHAVDVLKLHKRA